MDDLFKHAATSLGGDANPIELSRFLAHDTVKGFFQKTLIKPLWPVDTFAVYFQSRPDEWDFDPKARTLKVHSSLGNQIKDLMLKKRKTAPLPEKLYESLLRAGTMPETVAAISTSGVTEVGALPPDTIEALLDSFGKPLDAANAAVVPAEIFVNCQIKAIAACPSSIAKKGGGLSMMMDFYARIMNFGGATVDPRVGEQRIVTLKELCESAGDIIREKGLEKTKVKAVFLLCQTAPIHIVASAIGALGEKEDNDEAKVCAELINNVPAASLEGLPPDTLLRLATAATKSAAVAGVVLDPVAKASGATLAGWHMDDIAKLLLALSKAKAGSDSSAVASLYGRSAETILAKLADLSDGQLIKITIAFSKVPSCKEVLEAIAEEAVKRAPNIGQPQLLFLTQGLSPLGGSQASFTKILDCWAASSEETKPQLTADQLGTLAKIVAPLAPGHVDFWAKIGGRLVAQKATLTDAGKASLGFAFPDGAGPTFADKDKLLAAIKPPAKKEEKKDREKEPEKSKPKSGGDDRGRDGGRDDRARDSGRDSGRDRGRDDKGRGEKDRRDDRGRDDRRDSGRDRSRSRGDRRRR